MRKTEGRWKQSCWSRRRRGCEVAGVVDWPLASRASAVLQEADYIFFRCICRWTQKEISNKSIHQRKTWRVYTNEAEGRWKQSCRSRRRWGCEVAGVVDWQWPLASRAIAVLQEMNMRRRTVQNGQSGWIWIWVLWQNIRTTCPKLFPFGDFSVVNSPLGAISCMI